MSGFVQFLGATSRQLLAVAATVLVVLLGAGHAAEGHAGDAISVRMSVRATAEAGLVFEVRGHAHLPDGARLGVGLKRYAADEYVVWYDAYVSRLEFACTMGPWTRPFAPGYFVVEARFDFDRQAPEVLAEVRPARPAKGRPTLDATRGRVLVYLGSPFQEAREEAAAAGFFAPLLARVRAEQAEIEAEAARHVQRAAGTGPAAWQTCGRAWSEAETGGLLDLRRWTEGRVADRYAPLARRLQEAITHGSDLRRAWTRKLYREQVTGGGEMFSQMMDADSELAMARAELQKALTGCDALLPAPPK